MKLLTNLNIRIIPQPGRNVVRWRYISFSFDFNGRDYRTRKTYVLEFFRWQVEIETEHLSDFLPDVPKLVKLG